MMLNAGLQVTTFLLLVLLPSINCWMSQSGITYIKTISLDAPLIVKFRFY